MKHITLSDGTHVHLKIAQRDDYENGRYELLYAWLGQVDQFLAKKYAPEDLKENKEQWLRSFDKNRITLLSLHHSEIIGSATLILNDRCSRISHVASFGIAIHPDFQRKGLGRQLIITLEQIAREHAIKKMEVSCYERNAAAALYRSLNYAYEGRRLKRARLDDGTYVDEILFYKFLSPI